MAYGFNLGQIEGLDSSVQTVTVTIANATESNTYTLNKIDEDPLVWSDGAGFQSTTAYIVTADGIAQLRVVAFTESDVGDTYNVTISTSAVEENFKSAVEMSLEESGYPLIVERSLYDDSVTTVFDSQTSTYRAAINELLGIASGLDKLTVIINDQSASHYDEDDGYGYYEFPDASVGIKIELATGRLIDLYSLEAGTYALSISAKVPNTAFINAVKSALNIPTGDGEYFLDIADGVISWHSKK